MLQIRDISFIRINFLLQKMFSQQLQPNMVDMIIKLNRFVGVAVDTG